MRASVVRETGQAPRKKVPVPDYRNHRSGPGCRRPRQSRSLRRRGSANINARRASDGDLPSDIYTTTITTSNINTIKGFLNDIRHSALQYDRWAGIPAHPPTCGEGRQAQANGRVHLSSHQSSDQVSLQRHWTIPLWSPLLRILCSLKRNHFCIPANELPVQSVSGNQINPDLTSMNQIKVDP